MEPFSVLASHPHELEKGVNHIDDPTSFILPKNAIPENCD
jgi:hypothetical protein